MAAKMLKLALSTGKDFWASAASAEPAAKGEVGLHGGSVSMEVEMSRESEGWWI